MGEKFDWKIWKLDRKLECDFWGRRGVFDMRLCSILVQCRQHKHERTHKLLLLFQRSLAPNRCCCCCRREIFSISQRFFYIMRWFNASYHCSAFSTLWYNSWPFWTPKTLNYPSKLISRDKETLKLTLRVTSSQKSDPLIVLPLFMAVGIMNQTGAGSQLRCWLWAVVKRYEWKRRTHQ